MLHHRIVWRYPCLFTSVFNSLTASTVKRRREVNGVRRKRVSYKHQNFLTIPIINHYHDKTLQMPTHTSLQRCKAPPHNECPIRTLNNLMVGFQWWRSFGECGVPLPAITPRSTQARSSSTWAILNKSWRQHPTRHQLYGHPPPITKTIQARWTRHAGHCWRSKNELISDVLLWTPSYGQAKAGRPARTYIQQLCEDTGCSPEDLPETMNDWEKWRERVRDIRASDTTWWWYDDLALSNLSYITQLHFLKMQWNIENITEYIGLESSPS